jgi:hypothetical protein
MNNRPPSAMSAPAPYGVDLVTWEYKSFVLDAKKMSDPKTMDPINELGAQGWELVNTMPGNMGVSQILYTFKRPRRR